MPRLLVLEGFGSLPRLPSLVPLSYGRAYPTGCSIALVIALPRLTLWFGASPSQRTFAATYALLRLNNSELELLGHFFHLDVAAQTFDVRKRTIQSATDNLATLFWARHGSTTTTSPAATILRHMSLHQRFHGYVSSSDYVPGDLNVMADAASCMCTLSDAEFLTTFNTLFPQALPWHLYRLSPALVSSGISALRTTTSDTALFLQMPSPPWPTGASGRLTVPSYPSTLLFKTSSIPSLSSKQVFAYRFRRGLLNTSRRPVRSRTVEGALRSVGQALAGVGAPDPRFSPQGKLDHRLKRQLACYARSDDSWARSALMSPLRPLPNFSPPHSSRSNSPRRRMECAVKSSAWGAAATLAFARSRPPLADFSTFALQPLPLTNLLPLTVIPPPCFFAGSPPLTSPPRSASRSVCWARPTVFSLPMSLLAPFVPLALWHSCVRTLTPIASASLDAGAPTRCFANSTSKLSP